MMRRLVLLAAATAALVVPAVLVPAISVAAPIASAPSAPAVVAHQLSKSCAAPTPGRVACRAVLSSPVTASGQVVRQDVVPAAAPMGYGPADLQAAYKLPASGGTAQTVAVVAAHDNPKAEADLAVYRAKFGLPPCSTANGCFRKVGEFGIPLLPSVDTGWAQEISLDLDMVSAACPGCNILLVEANDPGIINVGIAEDTAVFLGAP